MPCGSAEDALSDYADDMRRMSKRMAAIKRMFCAVLSELGDPLPVKFANLESGEVGKWWKAHLIEDAARVRREQKELEAQERHKRLKSGALAKLSPDERKALNIE